MALTTACERRQSGKTLVVSLVGSLDTNTAPQLDELLERELQPSIDMLVLDMKQLDYISSAGLRSIFKASKQMKQRGGRMGVANRQPQITKVFDIVKALPDLDVFASQAEMDEYLTVMQNRLV